MIAKPITNDSWVVTDGNSRIGSIKVSENIYTLKIGNNVKKFNSTSEIQKNIAIEFQKFSKLKSKISNCNNYPTTDSVFNIMFDVKRKLYLYTKSNKSKCYYAAGYFKVKVNSEWETVFCPKYLLLQRHNYFGPYRSLNELESS